MKSLLSIVILVFLSNRVSIAQTVYNNFDWVPGSSVTSSTSPGFPFCNGPVTSSVSSSIGFKNLSSGGNPNFTTGIITPANIYDASTNIPMTISFSQPVCNLRILFTDLDGVQNEYLSSIAPAYNSLADVTGHFFNPGSSTQVNASVDNSRGWVEWDGQLTSVSFNYHRPGPGCGLIIDSIIFECCSTSPCGSYPILNLGNDITLCNGQSVNFSVPSGYDYFSWNFASGNPTTVTVNSTQTVVLNVQNFSGNLVVNGDFEAGDTGFWTGYSPGSGGPWGLLSNEGEYAITTNPNLVHSNFGSGSDHTTTGPGNMMVVNGSNTPNTVVWAETVAVDPNTNYNFSLWVASVANITQNDVAHLSFFINNVQVGSQFSPTLTSCDWQQFFEIWNSGGSTSADISIVAQTISGNNDFAIDDISFTSVCIQSDTVQVTLDASTIDAGPDVTFCENDPQTITATANYPNPSFTWETGSHNATITPATSGYMTVTATSPGGCSLIDSTLVDITPMPWNFQQTDSVPTECGANNGAVFTVMSGTFNDSPYYTWTGPGANSSNFIHASVWQNLSSGWYYISVESDGCYRYDSIFVTISNPPVAVLSGSPLTGDPTLDVSFTNSSTNATDYVWNFGNGNTATSTDNSGQSQSYTAPGTYTAYLVANQGNCHDTAFITIVVNTPPIPPIPPVIVPVDLSYPNVFTPNGDGTNDYFEFKLLNVKSIHVDVLNRWGEVVYSTDDVNFKWDGKIGGKMASEGVYTFIYEAKGAQDENLDGQGFVQLIIK